MATPYPPNPPQPPGLPPHKNNALLAVVLGIVIVLAVMIGFGIFIATRIARNTHIVENKNGTSDSVEIHSPLGDLSVHDNADKTKVDIRSPFGNLKVNTTPALDRLGMAIYPGAVLVASRRDSPFHDGYDFDDDHMEIGNHGSGDSTGAQVQLSSGNAVLNVNVAEFRTASTPEQVLDYYNQQLGRIGAVERKHERDGAISLKVTLSRKNVREAVVKPGSDGTHFVLVRVQADSAAR